MRVLFLPFEGVLHPKQVHFTLRGLPELPEALADHHLLENVPVLIEALQGHDDVRIVLATPWVDLYKLTTCLKRLPRTLSERVIGTTSEMRPGSDTLMTLSDQVQLFAAKHRYDHWAVLSPRDEAFPPSLEAHVIWTDPVFGVSSTDAKRALLEWLARPGSDAGRHGDKLDHSSPPSAHR